MAAPQAPYKTRVDWIRKGIMEPMEKEEAAYRKAKENMPSPKKMETVCYFLKTPPVIDGNGSDPDWKSLPICFLNDYKTGAPPKAETTFRMGYDNENLYVLFECRDPDVNDLRVQRSNEDNVYRDDCVELFLCFDPEKKRAVHLIVNAAGAIQDMLCNNDIEDSGWNLEGLQAKTGKNNQGYTVEMKIPLKAAGCVSPDAGTLFSGNFCREKYSGSPDNRPVELQSWSQCPEGFSNPNSFGQILFEKNDAWHAFLPHSGMIPSATLYIIGNDGKWTPIPGGMKTANDQDILRFNMDIPPDNPEIRKVTGVATFKFENPIDVSGTPYAEIRFRNRNPNIKLEFCYEFIDDSGKDNYNFFVFSSKNNVSPLPQTFIWDITKGNYPYRPVPKFLRKINIYAHVAPSHSAESLDFSISSIRLCCETMRGKTPELIPVGAGLH